MKRIYISLAVKVLALLLISLTSTWNIQISPLAERVSKRYSFYTIEESSYENSSYWIAYDETINETQHLYLSGFKTVTDETIRFKADLFENSAIHGNPKYSNHSYSSPCLSKINSDMMVACYGFKAVDNESNTTFVGGFECNLYNSTGDLVKKKTMLPNQTIGTAQTCKIHPFKAEGFQLFFTQEQLESNYLGYFKYTPDLESDFKLFKVVEANQNTDFWNFSISSYPNNSVLVLYKSMIKESGEELIIGKEITFEDKEIKRFEIPQERFITISYPSAIAQSNRDIVTYQDLDPKERVPSVFIWIQDSTLNSKIVQKRIFHFLDYVEASALSWNSNTETFLVAASGESRQNKGRYEIYIQQFDKNGNELTEPHRLETRNTEIYDMYPSIKIVKDHIFVLFSGIEKILSQFDPIELSLNLEKFEFSDFRPVNYNIKSLNRRARGFGVKLIDAKSEEPVYALGFHQSILSDKIYLQLYSIPEINKISLDIEVTAFSPILKKLDSDPGSNYTLTPPCIGDLKKVYEFVLCYGYKFYSANLQKYLGGYECYRFDKFANLLNFTNNKDYEPEFENINTCKIRGFADGSFDFYYSHNDAKDNKSKLSFLRFNSDLDFQNFTVIEDNLNGGHIETYGISSYKNNSTLVTYQLVEKINEEDFRILVGKEVDKDELKIEKLYQIMTQQKGTITYPSISIIGNDIYVAYQDEDRTKDPAEIATFLLIYKDYDSSNNQIIRKSITPYSKLSYSSYLVLKGKTNQIIAATSNVLENGDFGIYLQIFTDKIEEVTEPLLITQTGYDKFNLFPNIKTNEDKIIVTWEGYESYNFLNQPLYSNVDLHTISVDISQFKFKESISPKAKRPLRSFDTKILKFESKTSAQMGILFETSENELDKMYLQIYGFPSNKLQYNIDILSSSKINFKEPKLKYELSPPCMSQLTIQEKYVVCYGVNLYQDILQINGGIECHKIDKDGQFLETNFIIIEDLLNNINSCRIHALGDESFNLFYSQKYNESNNALAMLSISSKLDETVKNKPLILELFPLTTEIEHFGINRLIEGSTIIMSQINDKLDGDNNRIIKIEELESNNSVTLLYQIMANTSETITYPTTSSYDDKVVMLYQDFDPFERQLEIATYAQVYNVIDKSIFRVRISNFSRKSISSYIIRDAEKNWFVTALSCYNPEKKDVIDIFLQIFDEKFNALSEPLVVHRINGEKFNLFPNFKIFNSKISLTWEAYEYFDLTYKKARLNSVLYNKVIDYSQFSMLDGGFSGPTLRRSRSYYVRVMNDNVLALAYHRTDSEGNEQILLEWRDILDNTKVEKESVITSDSIAKNFPKYQFTPPCLTLSKNNDSLILCYAYEAYSWYGKMGGFECKSYDKNLVLQFSSSSQPSAGLVNIDTCKINPLIDGSYQVFYVQGPTEINQNNVLSFQLFDQFLNPRGGAINIDSSFKSLNIEGYALSSFPHNDSAFIIYYTQRQSEINNTTESTFIVGKMIYNSRNIEEKLSYEAGNLSDHILFPAVTLFQDKIVAFVQRYDDSILYPDIKTYLLYIDDVKADWGPIISNKTSDAICTAAYPDYINNRIALVTSGKSEADPEKTHLYLQIIKQDGTPYTNSYEFSDKTYSHLLFPNIKITNNYLVMTWEAYQTYDFSDPTNYGTSALFDKTIDISDMRLSDLYSVSSFGKRKAKSFVFKIIEGSEKLSPLAAVAYHSNDLGSEQIHLKYFILPEGKQVFAKSSVSSYSESLKLENEGYSLTAPCMSEFKQQQKFVVCYGYSITIQKVKMGGIDCVSYDNMGNYDKSNSVPPTEEMLFISSCKIQSFSDFSFRVFFAQHTLDNEEQIAYLDYNENIIPKPSHSDVIIDKTSALVNIYSLAVARFSMNDSAIVTYLINNGSYRLLSGKMVHKNGTVQDSFTYSLKDIEEMTYPNIAVYEDEIFLSYQDEYEPNEPEKIASFLDIIQPNSPPSRSSISDKYSTKAMYTNLAGNQTNDSIITITSAQNLENSNYYDLYLQVFTYKGEELSKPYKVQVKNPEPMSLFPAIKIYLDNIFITWEGYNTYNFNKYSDIGSCSINLAVVNINDIISQNKTSNDTDCSAQTSTSKNERKGRSYALKLIAGDEPSYVMAYHTKCSKKERIFMEFYKLPDGIDLYKEMEVTGYSVVLNDPNVISYKITPPCVSDIKNKNKFLICYGYDIELAGGHNGGLECIKFSNLGVYVNVSSKMQPSEALLGIKTCKIQTFADEHFHLFFAQKAQDNFEKVSFFNYTSDIVPIIEEHIVIKENSTWDFQMQSIALATYPDDTALISFLVNQGNYRYLAGKMVSFNGEISDNFQYSLKDIKELTFPNLALLDNKIYILYQDSFDPIDLKKIGTYLEIRDPSKEDPQRVLLTNFSEKALFTSAAINQTNRTIVTVTSAKNPNQPDEFDVYLQVFDENGIPICTPYNINPRNEEKLLLFPNIKLYKNKIIVSWESFESYNFEVLPDYVVSSLHTTVIDISLIINEKSKDDEIIDTINKLSPKDFYDYNEVIPVTNSLYNIFIENPSIQDITKIGSTLNSFLDKFEQSLATPPMSLPDYYTDSIKILKLECEIAQLGRPEYQKYSNLCFTNLNKIKKTDLNAIGESEAMLSILCGASNTQKYSTYNMRSLLNEFKIGYFTNAKPTDPNDKENSFIVKDEKFSIHRYTPLEINTINMIDSSISIGIGHITNLRSNKRILANSDIYIGAVELNTKTDIAPKNSIESFSKIIEVNIYNDSMKELAVSSNEINITIQFELSGNYSDSKIACMYLNNSNSLDISNGNWVTLPLSSLTIIRKDLVKCNAHHLGYYKVSTISPSKDSESKNNLVIIIPAIIGGVVLLIVILLLIRWIKKRNAKYEETNEGSTELGEVNIK